MAIIIIIIILCICVAVLFKRHTQEHLGIYVQMIDYNIAGGNNITCKSKDIRCNVINPRYKNKLNYNNILCHNNCTNNRAKLNTCCDIKKYCSDDNSICSGNWEQKKNSHEIECEQTTCLKEKCCSIKQTLYTKYEDSIIDKKNYADLTSMFEKIVKDTSHNNDNNFCRSACTLNETMPHCIGFSINEDNECKLYGLIDTYRATTIQDKKTDLYIKEGVIITKR